MKTAEEIIFLNPTKNNRGLFVSYKIHEKYYKGHFFLKYAFFYLIALSNFKYEQYLQRCENTSTEYLFLF